MVDDLVETSHFELYPSDQMFQIQNGKISQTAGRCPEIKKTLRQKARYLNNYLISSDEV